MLRLNTMSIETKKPATAPRGEPSHVHARTYATYIHANYNNRTNQPHQRHSPHRKTMASPTFNWLPTGRGRRETQLMELSMPRTTASPPREG